MSNILPTIIPNDPYNDFNSAPESYQSSPAPHRKPFPGTEAPPPYPTLESQRFSASPPPFVDSHLLQKIQTFYLKQKLKSRPED